MNAFPLTRADQDEYYATRAMEDGQSIFCAWGDHKTCQGDARDEYDAISHELCVCDCGCTLDVFEPWGAAS